MGCSTFSEYTVVADISCAKVRGKTMFFFFLGGGVRVRVRKTPVNGTLNNHF